MQATQFFLERVLGALLPRIWGLGSSFSFPERVWWKGTDFLQNYCSFTYQPFSHSALGIGSSVEYAPDRTIPVNTDRKWLTLMLAALSTQSMSYLETIDLFLALFTGKNPLPSCYTSFTFYYNFDYKKQPDTKTRIHTSAVWGAMKTDAQILQGFSLRQPLLPNFNTSH